MGYQPDLDWLYVDLDHDGRRTAGAGFDETTPGLSEPTFVGDDVDRSGTIDRFEHLIRLGTPKVRAVVVRGTSYVRGQSLTRYPANDFDLSHGTGAIGIVSAGAIGRRRYTGIAPEAELVLITEDDPVVGLAEARALGAHVSFYEWDSPADAQDGSGPFETALSDAAADGMVQLAAAGNLANADHVMELANVGSARQADLTTDGMGFYAFQAFWLNVHWNAPRGALSVAVRGLSGGTFDVAPGATTGVLDGVRLDAYSDETSHGNGSVLIVGTAQNGGVIPQTVLTLEVAATSSVVVPRVRGVLFDDQAGWGKGVSWLSNLTDAGSALMPSTSDEVIAVAAYGGRHDLQIYGWGAVDERRSYSGMGPRIDGAPVIDVSAPDDPFSPAASPDPGVFYGSFGGTSGALPHTAGAAAVLLSSGVPFSHQAIESLLTGTARVDAFTGDVPNEAYGYGKIDLGRAIFGSTYVAPAPPSLALSGPATAVVGHEITIDATVSQPGGDPDDVLIAWDLGYDGSEEQPLAAARRTTTTPMSTGLLRVLARAKNQVTGRPARALYAVEVVEDCTTTGCPDGCCGADGLCGECPPPLDAGLEDAGSPSDGGRDAGSIVTPGETRDRGCGCSDTAPRTSGLFLVLLLSAGLLLRRARAGSLRS